MKKIGFIFGIIMTLTGLIVLYEGLAQDSLAFLIPGLILMYFTRRKKTRSQDEHAEKSPAINNQSAEDMAPCITTHDDRSESSLTNSLSFTPETTIKDNNGTDNTENSDNVLIEYVPADATHIDSLRNVFFAIDVETTGLCSNTDRIIEIAAVKFVDGTATDSFSTLVNSVDHIPSAASKINGITDDDLALYGKDEDSAFDLFLDFIGQDVLDGKICLTAHNAGFDMAFITKTLERLGRIRNVTLRYFDTLSLSRHYLSLSNYRQNTVAEYFGITNENSHRAESDALTCGKILLNLLPFMTTDSMPGTTPDTDSVQSTLSEKKTPTNEDREVCAYIRKVLSNAGRDVTKLRFEKKSDGSITVKHPYGFADFRIPKSRPMYFIFDTENYVPCALEAVDDDRSHVKPRKVRVTLEHPKQIELLKDSLTAGYDRVAKSIGYYYIHRSWVQIYERNSFQISEDEMDSLVSSCISKADAKAREKALKEAEAADAERVKEERRIARKLRAEEKLKHSENSTGINRRRVGRYADDMTLLEEYESVSVAAKAVGISTKGIRDSASGRQKHAAGYVWRYMDVQNPETYFASED